jgi:hypothetical protein
MNKLYSFLMLCLFALGCIGGIGYSVYNSAYVIAIGVAGLSFLAWPQVVKHYNNLAG